MMWSKNKQSISAGDDSVILQAGRDINLLSADFPTELVDQKTIEVLCILRKSRFFSEFDQRGASYVLGRRLVEGNLSKGSDAVRGPALAWCARLLSRDDELGKAEEYLTLAKSLGDCPEVRIAEAFVTSQKGDKKEALNMLAGVNSPASRSAALMIVAHHDGGVGALDWLTKSGLGAADLDADGKIFLLINQLDHGRWDAAKESLDSIVDHDLTDAPILHHLLAMTHLLSAVPTELRAVVLRQLPFELAAFPLFSDATSLNARRTAQNHFAEAAIAAQQLNCPSVATMDDDYALWLELKDQESTDKGRQRLKAKLCDTKSMLRLVPLGLQFGVNLDLEAVQREIDQQIALHGGITPDAAVARFSLAFTQKTPGDVANYIAQHFDELSDYLDRKAMRFLQIEMLSRAGLPGKASECLDLLLAERLTEAEESRARTIISEAEGADPVEARRTQFEQTDTLMDLLSLIDELENRKDWDELCKYGWILFDRTRSVRNAERLATALSTALKSDQLINFLKDNPDLRSQSKSLQMFYSWALYHEGSLLDARAELAKLSADRENPNYRALELNLGIATGDWSTLSAIVANEYKDREKRSAHDLMGAARLALHLGSIHAKDLIFAAAEKAGDDAAVLAGAYFLATSAGFDDDSEVITWLHRAAELSGEDGPLQRMSLRDILDRKPDWDRRESETWKLLGRGEIPMFLAAQSLNKSLVDLTLFPALANLSEGDPRRRNAIPAYSGQRLPVTLDLVGISVGLEVTALLTLSFLGLLDKALNAFDSVYLAHSTLAWLFEEKQKAVFHQPSRIRNAHYIRDLLSRDLLEKFVPSTVSDSDLAQQVGDELALLIADAKMLIVDDSTQRLVVRSSPVHRLSSLMEEEADLGEHALVMSSCLSIVEKLREKGQITAKEEKKARAYLQLHEKPWPNQPEITDGAVLYLDDLAITYFQHLGMLEKLHAAGFRAIASPSEVSEANAFIAYEGISDKVNDAIEGIQSAINPRIESGKIKIDKQSRTDESETRTIPEHPTVGTFALASVCDAVISDDRFLNQHVHFDDGKVRTPILSTLDLLDALTSTGTISSEELLEYRTLLRRAGYFFIPVKEDELAQHLIASTVKNNRVIETAELKAIRENVLRVRMCDWLQIPKEAAWLDSTLKAFIKVLRGLWTNGADLGEVTVRSNWIANQVDVRGWAHSIGPENGDSIVRIGRGAHILLLLSPLPDAPKDIKEAYWNWVEISILAPIKEQFPDLYSWIVDIHRTQIAEITEAKFEAETT